MQQHWERVDGSASTREHLMMLLADLKSIRIKAKYAEDTSETRSVVSDIDIYIVVVVFCLHCFDAVGWAAGRASGL